MVTALNTQTMHPTNQHTVNAEKHVTAIHVMMAGL